MLQLPRTQIDKLMLLLMFGPTSNRSNSHQQHILDTAPKIRWSMLGSHH